jgi:hypothetical protein
MRYGNICGDKGYDTPVLVEGLRGLLKKLYLAKEAKATTIDRPTIRLIGYRANPMVRKLVEGIIARNKIMGFFKTAAMTTSFLCWLQSLF